MVRSLEKTINEGLGVSLNIQIGNNYICLDLGNKLYLIEQYWDVEIIIHSESAQKNLQRKL
jgi:uncharacterized protein (UPF0254 family)